MTMLLKRLRTPYRALVGAAIFGSISLSCGPNLRRMMPPAIDGAQDAIMGAGLHAVGVSNHTAIERSVLAAIAHVDTATVAIDPMATETARIAFLQHVENGNLQQAANLLFVWQPAADDADGYAAVIRLAIDARDFAQARPVAWDCVRAFPDERDRFITLWYESWTADEEYFAPGPHDVEVGIDVDDLEALGGGSTVTLRFNLNEETIGAFKPWQDRRQSNYRAEIAAYRLCSLIHCEFEVPRNQEVRIREDDFLDLYGIRSLNQSSGYSANFSALIWFEDDAGDRWIHGTLKEWIPGFTEFPIEYTDVWEPLVNNWISAERLEEMTFEDAIRGFQGRERGRYSRIVERREDTTAFDLAHQISDLHVFDFLINNWDRYSGQYWGVNCQWVGGGFISIDNGASFQDSDWGSWTTTRVRMERVRRFSRNTLDSIRWMDTDAAFAILFPDNVNHTDEWNRWLGFMERRQMYLDYVDELIAEYGEDRVVIFP